MRIIDTGITKEILNGDNHPQIKIGDKLYTVDDRKSTYDAINEMQKDDKLTNNAKERKLFEMSLGEEATKEIYNYELSVENFNNLIYAIMGAISGEDPKKIKEQTEQQLSKN